MINNSGLSWHIVEKAILEEKSWLSEVFDFTELRKAGYGENQPTTTLSLDEMLRTKTNIFLLTICR